MGKRKSKSGMTGLSRFVAVFNEGQSGTQPGVTSSKSSVNLAVQDLEPNGASSGELHGDGSESGGKTMRAEPTSTQTPILVELPKKKSASRYDATGLVPAYDDESLVPEHLKKCPSIGLALFPLRTTSHLSVDCRLFTTHTLFFAI